MDKVDEILEERFDLIKHIFIYLMSNSDYPGITMTDFTRFMKQFKIVDQYTSATRID